MRDFRYSIAPVLRTLLLACLVPLSSQVVACKRQAQESAVTESASLNGGFRIAPTQAARDALRPKVIYRCNAISCGEPFQPSNEEKEVIIPCDLDKLNFPAGVMPPYYRVVTERGVQQLLVKVQHQEACKEPKPFRSVVAVSSSEAAAENTKPASGCAKFRENRALCRSVEAEGCSWVTHPSGRDSLGRNGDCVGLIKGMNVASGIENAQVLQIDKAPVAWAPLESYRAPE